MILVIINNIRTNAITSNFTITTWTPSYFWIVILVFIFGRFHMVDVLDREALRYAEHNMVIITILVNKPKQANFIIIALKF